MKISEAIRTRRVIKAFKPDRIKQDDLFEWLETASYAPNHRMTEPWEIVMVGEETREKLNHKTNFGGAPTVLVILSKPAATPLDRDEHMIASACFVQNFMLAAHEAGSGVSWSSMASSPRGSAILEVPDGYDVIGIFGVGYPADTPALKTRTPIASKIKSLP